MIDQPIEHTFQLIYAALQMFFHTIVTPQFCVQIFQKWVFLELPGCPCKSTSRNAFLNSYHEIYEVVAKFFKYVRYRCRVHEVAAGWEQLAKSALLLAHSSIGRHTCNNLAYDQAYYYLASNGNRPR